MKKLWVILLAVMLVFGLVLGCDEDNSSSNSPKKPVDTKCKCTVAGCTCPGGDTCKCPVGCDCLLCQPGKGPSNECECGNGGCTCETPCPSGCECECCGTTTPGGCGCGKTGCECTGECDETCPCCGVDPGTPVYCKYCDDYYGSNEEAAHYGECYCLVCIEDWADCECLYIARKLTLYQNGENGLPEVGDDHEPGSSVEAEKATGKGYFTGKQFQWMKNANRGDKVLVRIYGGTQGAGTNNSVQWGNCGAVGIVHLEAHTDKRVDLTFGTSGLLPNPTAPVSEFEPLEFYVAIEDLWRVNTFEESTTTYGYINAWASGQFNVKDAFFCIPKEPVFVTDVTPTVKDFYVHYHSLLYYLDKDTLPSEFVTITPRYNMSQGVITIKYGDELGTTKPTEAGRYNITFDVAPATGFTAATGLVAGLLEINDTSPPEGTVGSIMVISGIDGIVGLDAELVAGTILPQYNAAANPVPLLTSFFDWNAEENRPVWVYENDAWSLRVKASDGNHGVRLNITFQAGDTINVKGRFASDTSGQIVVNSGDWDPVAVNYGIAAGASFDISGTFTEIQATRGLIRVMANNAASGSFFWIDSITITRPAP